MVITKYTNFIKEDVGDTTEQTPQVETKDNIVIDINSLLSKFKKNIEEVSKNIKSTEQPSTESKIDVKKGNVYKYLSSKKNETPIEKHVYVSEEGEVTGNTVIYNNSIDVNDGKSFPIYKVNIKEDLGDLITYISKKLGDNAKNGAILNNYIKMLNKFNPSGKDDVIKEINNLLTKLKPATNVQEPAQEVNQKPAQGEVQKSVQEPTEKVQKPVQGEVQKPQATNKPM